MTYRGCYDPSWLLHLIDAPNMQVLVELFASGDDEDKRSFGVSRIRMCEAYQAPRPRLDVIASFAGPGLYREVAVVDRSTFDGMKGTGTLRESLGLVGWTTEVLESLEKYWLPKMVMIESFWRMQPSLSSFPDKVWVILKLLGGQAEDLIFFNQDISTTVDTEVEELLRMQANGRVFLGIAINKRFDELGESLVWNLLFSANEISYDKKYQHKNVPDIYKILISDPRRDS
jgi:hypothetical protein